MAPPGIGLTVTLVVAHSPAALAELLAEHFLCRVQAAAFRGETIRVALSGGHTPEAFYQALARRRTECPWSALEIFFSDERAVGPDHPDSNYGMAYRAWLKDAPPGTIIHRIAGEQGAGRAARGYEALLAGAPLDLALLGLGPDGHTASLFPDDTGWRTPEPVRAVPATLARIARISLGMPVLMAARERWLIAQGPDKVLALREALSANADTPAATLLRQAPVTLWVDQILAQGLCDAGSVIAH